MGQHAWRPARILVLVSLLTLWQALVTAGSPVTPREMLPALHARAGVGQMHPVAAHAPPSGTRSGAQRAAHAGRVRLDAYAGLPLAFEANQGQTDRRVRFLARGPGYTLFLTGTGAVLNLVTARPQSLSASTTPQRANVTTARAANAASAASLVSKNAASAASLTAQAGGTGQQAVRLGGVVLRETFAGANPRARMAGESRLPGVATYLNGRGARSPIGVPAYSRVAYHDLYRGVDLVYYGWQGHLEYDIVVAPGADPGAIRLAVSGAQALLLDARGDLLLHGAAGGAVLRQMRPDVYQIVGGRRRVVSGRYLLRGGHAVGFQVGAYDRHLPLVIDPVLSYATYLGGSGDDVANAIVVDGAGNAYVAGATASADFPTATGAYSATNAGGATDAFVSKLSPDGSTLLYSTYLGGSGDDAASGVAVDAAGNAYVAGTTGSADFPTTDNAYPVAPSAAAGGNRAFLSRLDPSGATLSYSLAFGASGAQGTSVALDAAGVAYVAGSSPGYDLPTTSNAYASYADCGSTVVPFVAAFDTALSGTASLRYGSFLPPQDCGYSTANGVAVAATTGYIYLTGATQSSQFPTTAGAYATAPAGGEDAFVAALDPAMTGTDALRLGTYLGGSGSDQANAIAVGRDGAAVVVGYTLSSDFPVVDNIGAASGGNGAAFVTKLRLDGSGLVYSTLLGGDGDTAANAVALDAAGDAYVTGYTRATNFPTYNAVQPAISGDNCSILSEGDVPMYMPCADAFVTKFSPNGLSLYYSTYLGGGEDDQGNGIAVRGAADAYVAGGSASSDFPVAPTAPAEPTPFTTPTTAYATAYAGGARDAFVAHISDNEAQTSTPIPTSSDTPIPTATNTYTPSPTPRPTYTPGPVTVLPGAPYTWGANTSGQLGDGSTTERNNPVNVANLGSVSALATGGGGYAFAGHSLALLPDGTLRAWGDDSYGQLGDGRTTNSLVPVVVDPLGATTALTVAAGLDHSLAIGADGTVWAWGDNGSGELGCGSACGRQSTIPVQVPAFGAARAIAVAGGTYYSLALEADGTVWAWGQDNVGQLGCGNSCGSGLGPVQVQVLSQTVAIAAGLDHSLAVEADGSVWAWGDGQDGALGSSTSIAQRPQQVAGLPANDPVIAVAAGEHSSYALTRGGAIWAWGDDESGQLGTYATGTDPRSGNSVSYYPVQASLDVTATEIAAGGEHALAVAPNGRVYAWGNNVFGQLGNGTSGNGANVTPLQVNGLRGMSGVAAGGYEGFAYATAPLQPPATPVATATSTTFPTATRTATLTATVTGASLTPTTTPYPPNPTYTPYPPNPTYTPYPPNPTYTPYPTDTVTAAASTATATATPTSTATATAPAIATATEIPIVCTTQSGPQVFVTVLHRNGRRAILGGQVLAVTVRADPGTPATVMVMLYAPPSKGGAQVYLAADGGTTGPDGLVTIDLPDTYSPAKTLRDATLAVAASTACGADSQRLRVDIVPGTGTGTGAPTATATPAAATATPLPPSTETPTAVAATPTAGATSVTSCVTGADPLVFVTLLHSRFYSRYILIGNGLAVAVHATAGSTVAVTARLIQGAKTLGTGSADVAMGGATRQAARLDLGYAPKAPTRATLVLSVRDGCGSDTQRLAVTVMPVTYRASGVASLMRGPAAARVVGRPATAVSHDWAGRPALSGIGGRSGGKAPESSL